MSGLPQSRRVSYTENFAIDLSSADSLCCENVRVDNKVLRGFGALTDMLTHGIKFLNIIGVNNDILYLQNRQCIYRYTGAKAPSKMSMFATLSGDSTDGRYAFSRDALYLTYENEGLWTHDTTLAIPQINVFKAFENTHLDDVAVVNDRPMVLTEEDKIRFTECGDRAFKQYDKSNGAYLQLPSRVQAIKSLGSNTLYALGETCYKLTFSADESDIEVKAVARGLSRVFNHSVQVVGGKIIFATADGLYMLQGDKATRIFRQIDTAVSRYDDCYGTVWRGKYAFSVVSDDVRSTYLLDVDNQTCSAILHKDVKEMCSFQDNDYVLLSSGVFARIEKDVFADSRFARRGIDFGVTARKYLRRLIIETKYDVEVSLTIDGATRSYSVKGSDKLQSVPVFGSGRVLDIEIRAQQQPLEVFRFELLADVYKEDNYGN